MIVLGVQRNNPNVKMPKYRTDKTACFDICFSPTHDNVYGFDKNNQHFIRDLTITDKKSIYLHPGDRIQMPTGLSFKLSFQYSMETFADITREKEEARQFSVRLYTNPVTAFSTGLKLMCDTIVDVDNQHEVFVILQNTSEITQIIMEGNVIARGEVLVNEMVSITEIIDNNNKKV